MDLESSKSRPKVVEEEIRAISNGDNSNGDSLKLDFSAESGVPHGIGEVEGARSPEAIGSPEAVETKIWDGIGMCEAENSTTRSSLSPSNSVEVTGFKTAPMKGLGLRKWRRIRRDSSNNGTSNVDSALFLKRRLHITESPVKHEESKVKNVIEAEAENTTRNADMTSSPISTGVLDSELEVLASSGFSIGVDSDKSEDCSSKSYMVGSAPRLRHEAHGFGRERLRMKNFSGRGLTQVLQQHGQRRGRTADASKKFQEDYIRLEKENFRSSTESDFRSSAAGVLRQGSAINSNGIDSNRSMNFGGDHSDEAQTGRQIQCGYSKENVEMKILTRNGLHDELLEEDSKNCRSPTVLDPFMESIMLLQEAHKLLENGSSLFDYFSEVVDVAVGTWWMSSSVHRRGYETIGASRLWSSANEAAVNLLDMKRCLLRPRELLDVLGLCDMVRGWDLIVKLLHIRARLLISHIFDEFSHACC